MNKKLIYTCLIGKYDSLKTPTYINKDWDYFCFTDNPDLTSDIWNILPIPKELDKLDSVRKNRFIKILPHLFFQNYDFSIYIDGSIKQTGNLTEFQNKYCNDGHSLYLIPHRNRNCIYQEFFACTQMQKDLPMLMYLQSRKYHEEGFPYDYGLSHNCILFRYHNDPICKEIMETLWNQIINYSKRDQLSMFYSIWKTNHREDITMLDRNVIYKYFDYQNSWYHDLIMTNIKPES